MRRLAFVLCLFPLAATAAPHTVIYRLPSDARPAFVAGDLSGHQLFQATGHLWSSSRRDRPAQTVSRSPGPMVVDSTALVM